MFQTNFLPFVHGFKFSNNDTVWDVPILPIEGKFLCGGMVFSALDYFYANIEIPQQRQAPALKDPLNRYIIDRQYAAHVKTVPRMTLFWMFHDWYVESLAGEFDLIRKGVTSGRPVPLFLVKKAHKHGHHVLVTSCHSTPVAAGPMMYVYDPNYPEAWTAIERRPGSKSFDLVAPHGGRTELKGFFVDTNYAMHRPTAYPSPPEPLPPYPGPVDPIPPFPGPGPAPAPAPPAPAGRLYMVKRGDTLSGIAKSHYGAASRWRDIYAANRAVIGPNPNLIHPGQALTLPP